MDAGTAKAASSGRLPLLTSMILEKKFSIAYQILRIVYSDSHWVWPAENQDDVTDRLPDIPKTPPSLTETCLSFFQKSGKVYERHNFPPQLHLKTKAGCFFCTDESVCPKREEILASALANLSSSNETDENLKESVSLDETQCAQASTSTAVVVPQAAPTYMDWLKLKKEELENLGEESANIHAYAHFSLLVKKEMIRGWPLSAVCSLTGTLHLQFMLTLLRCGVHPNYPQVGKPPKIIKLLMGEKQREVTPFVQLLMRYECFKWVADNIDFSHTTEQLRASEFWRKFYLAHTQFQSLIWIDEHLKDNLIRGVYGLNGNSMKCTKEDYIRITSDAFQVLSYMIKLSNIGIFSLKGNDSVSDLVFGCGDLELASIIADSGKLSFDFDSQMKMFMHHYKTYSPAKEHQMERLLMKVKFNRDACCRAIPRALIAGYVQVAKILIRLSNCYTYSEYNSPGNPFIGTFRAALPVFILPLLQTSFWKNHVHNWTPHLKNNTVVNPSDLQRAVDSIEHVLDVVVRPLLEESIKDVSPAFLLVTDIVSVSQYGFLKEDLKIMNGDVPYFIFGNRGSLQGLCMRRVFRNLVNRKILIFGSRPKPSYDAMGSIIFPISVNGFTTDGNETPLSDCDLCSQLGILCPTCLKCEWSKTKDMLNSACDAAGMPRKFAQMLGLECLRYEVISRISSCAGTSFKRTSYGNSVPLSDAHGDLRVPNFLGSSFGRCRYPDSDVSSGSSLDDPSSSLSDSTPRSSLPERGRLDEVAAHRFREIVDNEETSDVTSSFSNISSSRSSSLTSSSDNFEVGSISRSMMRNRGARQRVLATRSAIARAQIALPPPPTVGELMFSTFDSDAGPSRSSREYRPSDCSSDASSASYQYDELSSSDED